MINYAEKLKSTNSGGLANAEDIAYEVTTGVDGDGEVTETKTRSVKDVLDDLTQGADSVLQAISDARVVESNVTQLQSAITNIATKNVGDMNAIKDEFDSDVADIRQNVSDVKAKADAMHYAFNSGTDFAVMSETEYTEKEGTQEIYDNVIYFLYD